MNGTLPRSLSAGQFRALFPELRGNVHLASCSFGARYGGLSEALAWMLEEIHRHGTPWEAFEEQVQAVRRRAAELTGTAPERIALQPNVTTCAFQAASTLGFGERPRIVTSADEFPSVSHVWLAQRGRGAEVVHVPSPASGAGEDEILQSWKAVIDERTALVSVPLVSFRSGAVFPVQAIAAHAHHVGAKVFVDAYQGAGVLPLQPTLWGCDYLATGTYKYLFGLPGLAFLYARDPLPGDAEPTLTGWMGRKQPFSFDPYTLDFAADARRFETGTLPIPTVCATNAALEALAACDPAAVQRHVVALVKKASELLKETGEMLAAEPAQGRCGPMTALKEPDAVAMSQWLADRRIAVSPRGEAVRLAFHYYNDDSDVEAACAAIAEYRHIFKEKPRPGRGTQQHEQVQQLLAGDH